MHRTTRALAGAILLVRLAVLISIIDPPPARDSIRQPNRLRPANDSDLRC
ncbi:MAG: hypothetical protein ACXVY6_13455 [Gaiellaceae bacterium]